MNRDSTSLCTDLPKGRRFCISLLLVGTLGAIVGSILMGRARNYFEIPPYPPELQAMISKVNPFEKHPRDVVALVDKHTTKTVMRNTSLAFALLAATAMPLLGLAAGFAIGSVKDAVRGFVAGIVVGSLFGGSAGAISILVNSHLNATTHWKANNILMVSHISAWVVFSMGLAVTIVAATQQWHNLWKTFPVAAIAGLVSALIYNPLAMLLSPLEQLDVIVPEGGYTRGLFAILGVGIISLATARSLVTSASAKERYPFQKP